MGLKYQWCCDNPNCTQGSREIGKKAGGETVIAMEPRTAITETPVKPDGWINLKLTKVSDSRTVCCWSCAYAMIVASGPVHTVEVW